MSEAKRKLFSLFRSRSTADHKSKSSPEGKLPRRRKSKDRPSTAASSPDQYRNASSPATRKDRRSTDSRLSARNTQLLTEWPPTTYSREGELTQGRAMELIASGVPVYKGYRRAIPHASDEYYAFFATCEGSGSIGNDQAEIYNEAFTASSFRLQGPEPPEHPWESLEHPSMAFCYGTRSGTVTLNHWVSLSGNPFATIELRDPGVNPREVELSTILDRLIYLEQGFEEDYEDLMYKNLYKNLLRDPDRHMNPHKAMEKQIADLIIVLSKEEWVDFSKVENQVVAKFFTNASYTDHGRYKMFFHQLLLSMELDYRIHSKHHAGWAKKKLLEQLPPSIAWDLALARKWRECMTVERYKTGGDPEQSKFTASPLHVHVLIIIVKFHLKVKKSQVKALRKFARAMKWPNLAHVDDILKERSPDAEPLEERSSDAMSYFTGMILPGITLPWLIMNTLIDCDDDAGTNALAALTHMHPYCGFQYKSTTYWSSSSIIGKVIGPTCQEIGGWIGPARPAPDLGRIQIARIRQRRPKQNLTASDVDSMTIRSDPLGPPSDLYPIAEYKLPIPDTDYIIDTVRIEKLALKPVASLEGKESKEEERGKPLTFDAAVQFAIDGKSWPLRLSYDVSFISAFPCSSGPHPLFFDYVYKAVKIDEMLEIRDWGSVNGSSLSSRMNKSSNPNLEGNERDEERDDERDDEREKVLVIEAFGVRDNEVLARAWCSHWGLSAVVCDMELCCMACAIREAYAGCLNVVILIDGSVEGADDEP
ncbi:hypothetical protein B7494_g147 [Chlorociboria aeruginascens]|nr:hypothetical protein B7494_g147 [Chlorociboria aeruginascens]